MENEIMEIVEMANEGVKEEVMNSVMPVSNEFATQVITKESSGKSFTGKVILLSAGIALGIVAKPAIKKLVKVVKNRKAKKDDVIDITKSDILDIEPEW